MTKKISLYLTKDYKDFLKEIKTRINAARLRASLAVNQEMINFYWGIGQLIIEKQKAANWGDKLIDALASDLKQSFPDTQGFSRSNLHSMKKFAQSYPTPQIVQALPGQLPWTHNLVLLERVKDLNGRLWYAKEAVENGWSYRTLMAQIKEQLYEAKGTKIRKTTNFQLKLPSPQSSMAIETIKDPYKFHFLAIGEDAHEKEIHTGLLGHIKQFLMALGQGFALYATHYPITCILLALSSLSVMRYFAVSIDEAVIGMIMALFFYIMFNIKDIVKLEFFQLKISLRKKIDEVDDILLKLREMAEILGEATASCIGSTQLNIVERMDIKYCHELIENVQSLVVDLGGQRRDGMWKWICMGRYLTDLVSINQLPEVTKNELIQMRQRGEIDKVGEFLDKKNIQYDKKKLENMCHYHNNDTHVNADEFLKLLE